MDARVRAVLWRLFPIFARIALFVVYAWFGAIKLFGTSAATPLAEALTNSTIGADYFSVSFALTGAFEFCLGVLFLIPSATRVVMPLLLVHLVIVCSPLVLIPDLAWTAPLVPTLEGQYIIKNVLIVALAAGLTAQIRPISGKSQLVS